LLRDATCSATLPLVTRMFLLGQLRTAVKTTLESGGRPGSKAYYRPWIITANKCVLYNKDVTLL